MQRIEAGALRGRKLLPLPKGVPGLRPTGARVRGAIFDRLQAEVVDAHVLDLFGGSGALTLEALSRGAHSSTVFEVDRRVVAHLRRQLEALGLDGQAEVIRTDAQQRLRTSRTGAAFDLVFVDPPFAMPDVFEPITRDLCENGWLSPGARVVCERQLVRGTSPPVAWPAALTLELARDYGQARVEFLRLRDPHPRSPS